MSYYMLDNVYQSGLPTNTGNYYLWGELYVVLCAWAPQQ